jgi:large subunit ribosomal protein L37Ae
VAKTTKKGTTRRFGARYGIKVRNNVDKIEAMQKAKQLCPFCRKIGTIKREAAGIFSCKKCNNKFTGKAYFIGKRKAIGLTETEALVVNLNETEEVVEKEETTKYKEEKEEPTYTQEALGDEE